VYYLLKFIAAVIGCLSLANISRFAWLLTFLIFDVFRFRRKLVLANLERAFGSDKSEEERLKIGRESVYNFVMTVLEFLVSQHKDLTADITINGIEHATAALDKNKGGYIICGHLGSWEALGAKFTKAVAPAYVVVKKVGGPGVDRFVSERRADVAFLTIDRTKKGDAYRAMVEVLKRGHMIGFAYDQARPGEPKLPFFGVPAKTNTSLAAIWRRHQAPIISAYIVREAPGKHRMEILPEIELEVTDDVHADIINHSIIFNKVLEKMVRRAPEHYLWLHNRWK